MTRREASHRRAEGKRFRNYGQAIGLADDNALHRRELESITAQYLMLLMQELLLQHARRQSD